MLSDIQEIGDDRPDQYLFYPSKDLKKVTPASDGVGSSFLGNTSDYKTFLSVYCGMVECMQLQ